MWFGSSVVNALGLGKVLQTSEQTGIQGYFSWTFRPPLTPLSFGPIFFYQQRRKIYSKVDDLYSWFEQLCFFPE